MKQLKIKARRDVFGPWLNLEEQSFYWVIETRKELEKNENYFVKKMVHHFEINVYDELYKPFTKEPLSFAIINEADLKYVQQFAEERKVKLFIEEYKNTSIKIKETKVKNHDGLN